MTPKPSYEDLEKRVRELEKAELDRTGVERELRVSKQLLRDVMDIVPVYLCAKDLDGRFILVNKKLTDFYGTTVEEMTGMLHADICEDEEELRSMLAADREVIDGGIPKLIDEETMERPDGSVAILRTYKIPFTAHSRPAVLIVSADITEQKKAEEERNQLEAQFHQAQKLESVGRLAGGVAHDLNNLLLPILGYGEMLLNDLDSNDPRKKSVTHMVNATERARDIVHQLLAFSRKQALEFKPVDLNKVLIRFEQLLRRTIREDIHINVALDPQQPHVRGDIGQLEQVIMNLAVNAQDAMPENGTLSIETSLEFLDENNELLQKGLLSGSYAVLTVSDTGHGIDPETRPKIFEPFFSTKGDQGTGLGLSTVYGIIKQHGGHIRLANKPGNGATFEIFLPASVEAGAEAQSDSTVISDLSGSETILLVEDNHEVRELARMILEKQGYQVLVAEHGEKALEILDHYEEAVHLLLTDVVMPRMNGRELFEEVSKRHPDMKVLFMSGYTNDVIAYRGVLGEQEGFIQKPFSVQHLASKIREVLSESSPVPRT